MITYITAFIFYTLAMIGILLVGFVVYKKTFAMRTNKNKGMMKILDCIQIAPKKNLLIVKVRNEKFLLASGVEHTTFLAKLSDENNGSAVSSTSKNRKKEPQKELQKELQREPQRETRKETAKFIQKEPQNNNIFANPKDYMSKYSYSETPYSAYNINTNNGFNEQTSLNEFQRAKLNKIQQQFRELYENSASQTPSTNSNTANKKDIVKKLLRELNETTSHNSYNSYAKAGVNF